MYFPSFLFGGSSFIHLLASHPRAVAVFGLGALLSTLWTPLGTPNVVGTAGQLARMEHHARALDTEDATTVRRAQESARVMVQRATPAQLAELVDTTLGQCGVACIDVDRGAVLANRALLHDVILLHELERAHDQRIAARPSAVVHTGTQN